jgi:hypothetical protein
VEWGRKDRWALRGLLVLSVPLVQMVRSVLLESRARLALMERWALRGLLVLSEHLGEVRQ